MTKQLVDKVERLQRLGVAADQDRVADERRAKKVEMAPDALQLFGDPVVDRVGGRRRPLGRRPEDRAAGVGAFATRLRDECIDSTLMLRDGTGWSRGGSK